MTGPELSQRWRTRWRVMRARRGGGGRGGLVWQPAPRGAGSAVRGQPFLTGVWHLAGHYVETEADPWDIVPPSVPFEMQVHGQGWLDDVMATGGPQARDAARGWVLRWTRRFGRGEGRGWDPALTGRRLLRWIDHAPALTEGMTPRERAAFAGQLQVHAGFLAETWEEAPAGLPRMEALTGLLHGGMTLAGREALAEAAARGLVAAVETEIAPDGGIASRNPEALLETVLLMNWCADLLAAAGAVPEPLIAGLERARDALRALRHADGGLARFHGGGRGLPGRLERALGAARSPASRARVMGFLPVAQGGTTLVADAAPPPSGAASGSAHASTLAFEMTRGLTPLVVNCGPGGAFGPEWHRAGRATASHSTLQVGTVSSARIGAPVAQGGRRIAPLVQGPATIRCKRDDTPRGTTLTLSHDGYVPSHGLVHLRRLVLSADGRRLDGEDALLAPTPADRIRFATARDADRTTDGAEEEGVPFHIRFHLHPDVEAAIDPDEAAVSIALPSGEVWMFRSVGAATLSLEASVHLEPGRRRPRPARQVVLFGRAVAYGATIGWTLAHLRGPASEQGDEE